ncbi:hypothetical protein B6U91_00380 [Candidatus Pacearchaeota archaeon ex4484_71]|nr:MAG: hypothetical protein B6U91_00380 [Candidatus Pacearchaeota archaeon ex4484_71]
MIVILLPFIISFVLAVKLRKGRKWAKIVSLIFAIAGVLFGVSSLFSNSVAFPIISLVINAFIVWALLFDKSTKEFFSASR